MGDLNADIGQAQNLQRQQVAYLLIEFGLVDLLCHFRQCLRFHHLKTWSQVRQDRFLQSHCKYILGLYCWIFETVGIRDLRNFSSDHYTLRACLLQHPTRYHTRYLQGSCALPLTLPAQENFIPADAKLQNLKALEPPPLSCPPHPQRISEELILLIDDHVSLCWNTRHKTCYSSICHLSSHSLVCIENYLFIVGIWPILYKYL